MIFRVLKTRLLDIQNLVTLQNRKTNPSFCFLDFLLLFCLIKLSVSTVLACPFLHILMLTEIIDVTDKNRVRI